MHDILSVGEQSYEPPIALFSTRTAAQSHAAVGHADAPHVGAERVFSKQPTSHESTGRVEGAIATSSTVYPSAQSSPRQPSPSSLFEIQSSDDDSSKFQPKRPVKKRKVVSAVVVPTVSASTGRSETQPLFRSQTDRAKLESKVSQNRMESEEMNTSKHNPRISAVENTGLKPMKQPPQVKATTSQSMGRGGSQPRARPLPAEALRPRKTTANKDLRVSSDSSAHHSDDSNTLPLSRHSTPKRRRGDLNEGAVDSPSPSDLQMTSLRLTSHTIGQDLQVSSEDEVMTDASQASHPPPRRRKRLVDRLDAPASRNAQRTTAKVPLHPGQTSRHPASQPVSGTTSPGKAGAAPPLTRADTAPLNSANVALTGRLRATYARQRSYLSDMVDSLESRPGSFSQPSSQQDYFSQTSFTALGSQMDLVHEDSDDDDSTQIKSIHELRRGGAIRKFDLDLNTIVEDIEAESKSLRIQALIQLNRKLEDLTLCRHFQDSSTFSRFLECAKDGLDDVSAILMAFVFQKMSDAESSSPKSCLQMLGALTRLPSHLLSESRSLSRLAKDRSQNLSKLLIRDMADFDEHVSQGHEHGGMPVNTVFLGAIDGTLRSLIRLKEALPHLSRPLLDAIIHTLVKTEEVMPMGQGRDDQIKTVQQLLSILEVACANHETLASSVSSSRVADLGNGMAGILERSRGAQPLMEQSCLRLIVSLSNNEPKVCKALGRRRLIATVFQVIEDHFSALAGLAAREEDFDAAQLDSVILAVGCLLNLAECADAAREQMLEQGVGGRSLVDRLVDVFNSHVDQASEVCEAIMMKSLANNMAGHDHAPDTRPGGFWIYFGIALHAVSQCAGPQAHLGIHHRRGTRRVVCTGRHLPQASADGRSCSW